MPRSPDHSSDDDAQFAEIAANYVPYKPDIQADLPTPGYFAENAERIMDDITAEARRLDAENPEPGSPSSSTLLIALNWQMQAQIQLAHFAGEYLLNLISATESSDTETGDGGIEIDEPAAATER